jgi:hypothetical protein
LSYSASLQQALYREDPGMLAEAFHTERSSTSYRANGVVSDCRETIINAPPVAVREYLDTLGGGRGWLYADWLWRLRGWMDARIGGVGMRRKLLRVIPLEEGVILDFWRVKVTTANRLLLRAEMKVPGKAWLQFQVEPSGPESSRLRMIASFEPLGLIGELYWTALYPIHKIIFNRMLASIKKELDVVGGFESKKRKVEDPLLHKPEGHGSVEYRAWT